VLYFRKRGVPDTPPDRFEAIREWAVRTRG
jgi:hypothetical protein